MTHIRDSTSTPITLVNRCPASSSLSAASALKVSPPLFTLLLNFITNIPFSHPADHRYPFYKKEGGGFSTPEMDADWEKGIFPMGQVPVLQANGHRFPQVRSSYPPVCPSRWQHAADPLLLLADPLLLQSKAIERYIARKVHLIGDNEEQVAAAASARAGAVV